MQQKDMTRGARPSRHTHTAIPRIRTPSYINARIVPLARPPSTRNGTNDRSPLGSPAVSPTAARSASESSEQLASTLQGYRVFPMDGCSFMIKETADEKLVIADAFVTDELTGAPTQLSSAPPVSMEGPTSFQEIEWAAEYPGNDLEDRPASRWVLKTYLVAEQAEGGLDFDRVALLDAATRSISFPSVTRLAPADTPEELLELRIRDSGLVIDTVESLPDAESVVRSKLNGVPASSRLETELLGGDAGHLVLGDGTQGDDQNEGDDDDEDDVDTIIVDDAEELDDFLDVGDEIDSDDEEFEGDQEADEEGDDFD